MFLKEKEYYLEMNRSTPGFTENQRILFFIRLLIDYFNR